MHLEERLQEFHTLYTITFMLISLVVAAIYSAITITSEKEASTLEVLLTTPLTARDIVFGKALGVVKRLWAVLPLLAGTLGEIFNDHHHFLAEGMLLFNPFVLDAVCFHTLCEWSIYDRSVDSLVFDLPVSLKLGQAGFAALLAGISACYVFLGSFFLESAVWRIGRLRS